MNPKYTVVGVGELLWDVFPAGKRLGGAPVNFAYHCSQLGAVGYPVSCIGRDALGCELRAELRARQVHDAYITEEATHPTGTVQVTLDASGKPSYEICEGVAWDCIPMSDALAALARQADALCFGSLAQRSETSRATIQSLLQAMRPQALKIFDINLRLNFHTRAVIETSLELSNILKLNDEELPVLAGMFGLKGSAQDQLAALRDAFSLQLIAYTRGKDGSLLLGREDSSDYVGEPVEVVDSVGAGDSFTAALCMGLLHKKPLAAINEHASRVAAFVCTQSGATPPFSDALKQ